MLNILACGILKNKRTSVATFITSCRENTSKRVPFSSTMGTEGGAGPLQKNIICPTNKARNLSRKNNDGFSEI